MPRKKYTPEEIIQKLREAEIHLGQGKTLDQVCRRLAISEPPGVESALRVNSRWPRIAATNNKCSFSRSCEAPEPDA
jgi:hypothetical protein